MFVLVLPISGPKFICQISAMLHLSEIDFIPDITLSSSGGNVTAYLLSAAQWKRHKIIKLCYTLNSTLFLKKWCYSDTISYIIGFFRGTIYNKGQGAYEWLENIFNEDSIQKDEIWTGTYNKKLQKPCLFTNVTTSKYIKEECFYTGINQCMPLCYLNGNMELISKTIMASASIPGFVPEENINGHLHTDGGVYSASPVVLLSEPIVNRYHKLEKKGEKMNIIYVSPINSYESDNKECINFLDNVKQASDDFVRSNSILDKVIAHNMIKNKDKKIYEYEFLCTLGNLERIKKVWNIVDRSMLEIYPIESLEVNINSFTGEEVVEMVEKCFEHLKCKFWFIELKKRHEDEIMIKEILQKCVDYPNECENCVSI